MLVDRLKNNYHLLHRQYRLGNFEGQIGHGRKCPVNANSPDFYELCESRESASAGDVRFMDAIQDLYDLTSYIEQHPETVYKGDAMLILRCKCLIYEVTDYLLRVPPKLGAYFVEHGKAFPERTLEVEKMAEALNGGAYPNKDERAAAVKLLVIAGICGANQLYREHDLISASKVLEKLNRFIEKALPAQHEVNRASFGLHGLSQYLTGRVYLKRGLIRESQLAFQASVQAYVARLRQKEELFRQGRMERNEYEETVSVTTRRAALVSAFGYGRYYFVNGQLTRALESLRSARASLTRNSGMVHLAYIDMLYWSCRRATESSNPTTIEQCVHELENCRNHFRKLIPDGPHFHRAGIQLALSLLYQMKLTGRAGSAYREGLRYLDQAIDYARTVKNPSLLARALMIKSRFYSSRCRPGKNRVKTEKLSKFLTKARTYAEEAHEVCRGNDLLKSEASAILGNVYTALAALDASRGIASFQHNFDSAFKVLQRSLRENNGQNIRNEALCYLYLTRLFLLSSHTMVAAHEYFKKWQDISNNVEHQYCKSIATEVERKLGPRVLIINAGESLKPDYWEPKLRAFLLKEALQEFVVDHFGKSFSDRDLTNALSPHLRERLGFASSTVAKKIRTENLLETVRSMMSQKPDIVFRRKRRSYSNNKKTQ